MESTEFKINDYLSLELRGGKTFIYVNGKKFKQCKYVLLNIPIDNVDQYSSANSIDEIMNTLDHSLEEYPEILTPEVEFWAHCSNLQAWADNNYNTDLLDSFLSFPLLKKLTQEGELQAKRVFKEEIAKRLLRGDINNVLYLINEGYLEFLTNEEITLILSSENCFLFEKIFNIFKKGNYDQFNEADIVYDDIGKYFYPIIEKKLREAFNTKNIEDLFTFLNYQMLDVLSEEEILLLFEHPMNLLEKIINILNNIEYKEINIGEYGFFSEKVEKILGDRIKEKIFETIHKGNIKYSLLWKLDLLRYLENDGTEYLDYLK